MTTQVSGRAVLDTLIKEAAERNELAGLAIRVPETAMADLAPDVTTMGRSSAGQIAKYNGVELIVTPRIRSWSQIEVYNAKEIKENKNNERK